MMLTVIGHGYVHGNYFGFSFTALSEIETALLGKTYFLPFQENNKSITELLVSLCTTRLSGVTLLIDNPRL